MEPIDLSVNKQTHERVMEIFERTYPKVQPTREKKEFWRLGQYYCHGETNAAFVAFRAGVALGAMLQRQQDEENIK